MNNDSHNNSAVAEDNAVRQQRLHIPPWLKRPVPLSGKKDAVTRHLRENLLHTVCEEARCPNRGECYAKGTATFLIMGETCTRNCTFCAVNHGKPQSLDQDEADRIAHTVAKLELKYVVLTSVTRDDLPDGGAAYFAKVIHAIRSRSHQVKIEVLVPDFNGDQEALRTVVQASPDVFNHNVETVSRLYAQVRPQANYQQSLRVLRFVADCGLPVKSGIMVGLGETYTEVVETIKDMYAAGCRILTIGQYLQPSANQVPVQEFVTPETFKKYASEAKKCGFSHVASGPYVRSSYEAHEAFNKL